MKIVTPEEVRTAVYEAFKNVTKGTGIGVREANAIDNWADREAQEKARAEDVEQHWWDIPREWQEALPEALTYLDVEGFRFLLPAAMTAALDPLLNRSPDHSVYFVLCNVVPDKRAPHHGHKEYVQWLKKFSPQTIISYYGFDQKQVHAIALFLAWWMQGNEDWLYQKDPQKHRQILEHGHDQSLKHARPGDYKLDLADVIAIYNEECRILRAWLVLGGVPVPDPQTYTVSL